MLFKSICIKINFLYHIDLFVYQNKISYIFIFHNTNFFHVFNIETLKITFLRINNCDAIIKSVLQNRRKDMRTKEIIAMLLAGGQGSRLGVLSHSEAKPAVFFGGKYRIIDFALSNCINSGIDTVGVLTQYQPLTLHKHIGIGTPWDLDRTNGGVTILAPHLKSDRGAWYSGTANAIYQNINFIDAYQPEYVLVISGDHIYKMDYSKMLGFHVKKNADLTIAVLEIDLKEANRFGIMNADKNDKIYEFEEKPENPKSNLASMGIYIFDWQKLRTALIYDNKIHADSDFGKHIIPMMLKNKERIYAYRFNSYWKDVGTIESYWKANRDLIKTLPDFNLYEDFWKVYTNIEHQAPKFIGESADLNTSIISEGCEIYGKVYNCIVSSNVLIEPDVEIRDSIIMANVVIKKNSCINKAIIDENAFIDENVKIGIGENIINKSEPKIYNSGISVIGKDSFVPKNIFIGKNCVVSGKTSPTDYKQQKLLSGESLILKPEKSEVN